MDDHNISMLTIQEHRRIHEDKSKYEQINNHVLITSSAVRDSARAAIGGVGLLPNKKTSSAPCEVTFIFCRIMQATFAGNLELTLISVYVPTNCENEEPTEEIYSQLKDAIGQTPQRNLLLTLGEKISSAKKSSGHTHYAHNKRTNEFCVILLDLSCKKSLIIGNNNLLKRDGKRWTFEDSQRKRYRLDYVLINSKWKNSVMNVNPHSSFAFVGSDHTVVKFKLRLSLHMPNSRPLTKRYDWRHLIVDKDLCSRFTLELKNK